jgi:hypothetical protein
MTISIINFSEMPLNRETRAKISRTLHQTVRVIEPCLYVGLDHLSSQMIRSCMDQVESQAPWVWAGTVILVLPDSGHASAVLLDEARRRLGHLPPVMSAQSAEIFDLEAII